VTLVNKENEYLYYLANCIDAVTEVVTRTQAIVRGFLVRR
jgi:hypothetical protein